MTPAQGTSLPPAQGSVYSEMGGGGAVSALSRGGKGEARWLHPLPEPVSALL